MSLVSTSNSAAVFAGFASASTNRATTRTSGAAANSDPPVTAHSKPSSRSARAYVSARDILPSSTTMSPGACPHARSAANRRAMARAQAAFASSTPTPLPRAAGRRASTRSMRGPSPRYADGRPSCGSSDMKPSPNTWGCSNTRSTNASTSAWLRKFFASST